MSCWGAAGEGGIWLRGLEGGIEGVEERRKGRRERCHFGVPRGECVEEWKHLANSHFRKTDNRGKNYHQRQGVSTHLEDFKLSNSFETPVYFY